MRPLASLLALLFFPDPPQDVEPLPLDRARSWAYQIQDLDRAGALEALAASPYDLLVVEPTRTERESADFDAKAAVAKLKAARKRLVVAYLAVGEAEDWRWYWTWSREWKKGRPRPADWPSWIVVRDPDGWSGCWPVAFWDPAWKKILLGEGESPRGFAGALDQIVRDGFDGVYLDWVEGYAEPDVAAAARAAGVDPAKEMARLLAEIRAFGRRRDPRFVVIQQNASRLAKDAPASLEAVDGIAQEDVWYFGEADAKWEDPKGHDRPQEADFTRETIERLQAYRRAGKSVFTVDYAVRHAPDVYARARRLGFVPYCSRVCLDRLTDTPER